MGTENENLTRVMNQKRSQKKSNVFIRDYTVKRNEYMKKFRP